MSKRRWARKERAAVRKLKVRTRPHVPRLGTFFVFRIA